MEPARVRGKSEHWTIASWQRRRGASQKGSLTIFRTLFSGMTTRGCLEGFRDVPPLAQHCGPADPAGRGQPSVSAEVLGPAGTVHRACRAPLGVLREVGRARMRLLKIMLHPLAMRRLSDNAANRQ